MKKTVSVSTNVLDHNLVPKMKVLGEKEKQKVLEKYNITENDLPHMLLDDPAAKALEAKIGDIIEIKREDPTGSYEYYRLVVE